MSKDPEEVEEFVYLEFDDALEIYGAIIGGSAAQAADHLRSREALAGALARPINYAHTRRPAWAYISAAFCFLPSRE